MDAILALCRARGASPSWRTTPTACSGASAGKALGTFGALATLCFHETKNITCGEGGALLVNDPSLFERAEIVREKGTDRSRFFRGQVDKYSWVDLGSSYLPSDLLAAFLPAQLEAARGDPVEPAARSGRPTRTGLADWAEQRTACGCRTCPPTASSRSTCSTS